MATDRFLIAPFETGLQTYDRPWLIPDDAFASLRNAYVFRGSVIKRAGARLTGRGAATPALAPLRSRLRIALGVIPAMGPLIGTVPGAIFKIGQLFSVDTSQLTPYINTAGAQVMYTTGTATGTYDISNGAYSITGLIGATVYFYPAQPVMGLTLYESGPVTEQPAYAFDTQFAYIYNGTSWERSATMTVPTWHGSDTDFFWTCNWQAPEDKPNANAIFVTNYQAALGNAAPGTDDPIYYFDGTDWKTYSTATDGFTTVRLSGEFVLTAQIIVVFKNRLFLLNTIEQDAGMTPQNTQYTNRARFSANASPFVGPVTNPDNQGAFLEVTQAGYIGGGYIDAATEENIVSAEFIKDRLIVYFERSTWEIVYTGNDADPFRWQKINTELGSESTFSIVPFDKSVLAIGNVGVHACTGANVERIDIKIPDQVFDIKRTTNSVKRVHGIRDYFSEVVYWAYSSQRDSNAQVFPNKVLLYNYRNDTWAVNDDTVTCWGYLEQGTDLTWADATFSWASSSATWISNFTESNGKTVLAGNQEGFVFIVAPSETVNAPVMQITNIVSTSPLRLQITAIDHNLIVGDYVKFNYVTGYPGLEDEILQVVDFSPTDKDTFGVITSNTGTYAGGGYLTRVSQVDILSKQWNPYVKNNRNFQINKIDFCVITTDVGSFTVDSMVSSSEEVIDSNIVETRPYTLYPLESTQKRLWHPIYPNADGEFIQVRIYFSDIDMLNNFITSAQFQIEGICLYTSPSSSRMQ